LPHTGKWQLHCIKPQLLLLQLLLLLLLLLLKLARKHAHLL
jgi:hypothetical protein